MRKYAVVDPATETAPSPFAASTPPKVAVLIPCFQEAAAIGKVVHDFRSALPDAAIYVYDNNSRDRTADVARAAGAIVRYESQQGKGHVVRRMFRDIDADFYLMVDGDGTYDVNAAAEMIASARGGALRSRQLHPSRNWPDRISAGSPLGQ